MAHRKILVYNWRCWLSPEAGGAEVFTREVLTRWVETGHEVTLFSGQFPNCKREEYVNGVRIVRAGGKYSLYRKAKDFYTTHFSSEGFDVVVDQINTRPFFAPKFVKKGEKVVALIHQLAREYWFYETPFPASYLGYYFLENRWLKDYVNVPTVTVSKSTEEDLIGLGFKKIFVISEGLNFEPLDDIPDREIFPVVAYSGRLKRAKRPDHAIRAFSAIKDKLPNAELWILGEGPYRKTLEGMSTKGVRFFGKLSDLERRKRIKRSWVLINPSVREGWGLNVIEAAGLGVPCVAYNVPGLRDSAQDGITGVLAESGNIKDLAMKTMTVLEDGAFRNRLSWNALERSRQFSWDNTAKQFFAAIESVVNGE